MRLIVLRASYFSYISSTSYIVSFLGPTLAAVTMSRSLWLPFWINIALLALAVPTIGLISIPENKHVKIVFATNPISGREEEAGPLLADQDTNPDRYSNAFQTKHNSVQAVVHAARRLVKLVAGRRNFQILLCSFFLTALASSDTKLLVQYISKRYKWTFAEAGYMLSAKALVNFALLAVVVPRIIKASMSQKAVHGHEVRLNYIGTEISILVSVVGVLFVALAFHFWILLGGKHVLAYLAVLQADPHSTRHIRAWFSTTSLHHVTCQVATYHARAFRHSGLQHSHVDQDVGLTCWSTIDDSALGQCNQVGRHRTWAAILRVCRKLEHGAYDTS
jgi:hypothetical protein